MPATHYRRYATGLKLQYAAGALHKTVLKQIPRSTHFYWKGLQPSYYWHPENCAVYDHQDLQFVQLLVQSKRLLQCLRLLLYIVFVYRDILKSFTIRRVHILSIKGCVKRMLAYAGSVSINEKVWRLLPFTKKQWQAWGNAKICGSSLLSLCRKRHPQQISINEQQVIKDECNRKDYEHWPLLNIYCQMMRDSKLHCSRTTFYKYCRLLNITRKRVRKPVSYTPLLAKKPLQILHLDTTVYKTANNVKHYLYVVRDNFSRAILGCKASLQYSSESAKALLQEVLTKYSLMEKEGTLVTDDGPENKGVLTDMLAKPGMLWKKLIAQVDIVQSNSMVEAANKILKYQYLFVQNIADTEALENILPVILNDCNNRSQYLLSCYTPNEVVEGAIPDKQRFKQAIEQARKKRIAINRTAACDNTC